ncbi:MAG: family 78 glycoside hydrolase catalytic domain [Cyclobacteriaceae bacterium]|nr:family 78 glycoside hydrolase catalytic domain [Cyclobacteriaceae bacterium SS2]
MKVIQILLFSIILIGCSDSGVSPIDLTCEYLKDPTVVDVANPKLSWINISTDNDRAQRQTAYQIRVASSKSGLTDPDLWDSEKVSSEQSFRVLYKGSALKSGQDCWWQVRTWDKNDKPSEWSKPAYWGMGLLQETDWTATWIGVHWQGEEALPIPPGGPNAILDTFPPPAPMLRKSFEISKKISRAKAYVTGLGYFEFYVNGKKMGDEVLIPNQTNYGKRPGLEDQYIPVADNFREYKVMYLTYDVTNELKQGENVIGSILGNGFYNPAKFWTSPYGSPRFFGQVEIEYADGTKEIIASDLSWKADKSPILMDMVYYGEKYDARLEQQGWSAPGFDDSEWTQVVKRAAPYGKLVAHTAHPDKITETFKPLSIKKKNDSVHVVDFGTEISGWVRLNNVNGPAGHQIDIDFLSNQYSGENTYIFSGKGKENYAPRFNWFVFSAIEITNWPGELKKEHLTAEAVNTYVEETGTFETSNKLFNDINKIWKRSQTDNMHGGLASDCPHRERSGYTGDGQVACLTVMHNFDARNFYQKWIQDILGAQNVDNGYVPNGAPWQRGCGGGVPWGAAMSIMPWHFYVQYGALDILEDNYEGMKAHVEWMKKWVDEKGIMFSKEPNEDDPVVWMNLGEWAAPTGRNSIPQSMVHTFYFWRCADFTAKAAKALGQEAESTQYASLAESTRKAFYQEFYDTEKGSYGNYGGNVLALTMGVPEDQRQKVVAALEKNVENNDRHLDTGIFGTRFFFEVLAENGLNHLAYAAMNQKTEPSFGRWLELGSTTTREHWNEDGSHNHPMFGGGIVWFYRNLAGMKADPGQPGYKHIIFKPQPISTMDFVKYSYKTSYGKAGIYWQNKPDAFQMKVEVPVGSKATVYVPASPNSKVTEGGIKIESVKEIAFLESKNGYKLYEVGSGIYEFKVGK